MGKKKRVNTPKGVEAAGFFFLEHHRGKNTESKNKFGSIKTRL